MGLWLPEFSCPSISYAEHSKYLHITPIFLRKCIDFHLGPLYADFCKVLVSADRHGVAQRPKRCVSCKTDKIQVTWQEYFIGDAVSSFVALM